MSAPIPNRQDLLAAASERLDREGAAVSAAPWRQVFHLQPPIGFMNDPNGFIDHDGLVHLYWQYNPFLNDGPKHVFWGHFTSPDLVTWTEQPVELSPTTELDKDGCYSGSAIEVDGAIHVLYTGNVKDADGNRLAFQNLATSPDGFDLAKADSNPAATMQPGYTGHFRDPKVWAHQGRYHFVLGAQRDDLSGAVVLFSGDDTSRFEFTGELTGIPGTCMLECPDLFWLDDEVTGERSAVLVTCPQGLSARKAEGGTDRWANPHNCAYQVGSLDWAPDGDQPFTWQGGDWVEVDRGFEFYAPQTMLDRHGRRILIAWMGLPDDDDQPTLASNWMHCQTIPRLLTLHDGVLHQTPLPELSALRSDETILDGTGELITAPAELSLTLDEVVELRVGTEDDHISLMVDPEGRVDLDRTEADYTSAKIGAPTRQAHFDPTDGELRIFVDESSIEVFVGGISLTSRHFVAKPIITALTPVRGTAWQLGQVLAD